MKFIYLFSYMCLISCSLGGNNWTEKYFSFNLSTMIPHTEEKILASKCKKIDETILEDFVMDLQNEINKSAQILEADYNNNGYIQLLLKNSNEIYRITNSYDVKHSSNTVNKFYTIAKESEFRKKIKKIFGGCVESVNKN